MAASELHIVNVLCEGSAFVFKLCVEAQELHPNLVSFIVNMVQVLAVYLGHSSQMILNVVAQIQVSMASLRRKLFDLGGGFFPAYMKQCGHSLLC